ncbi:MAG: hypothetical protein U1F36_19900 [Planctomycetota bacterium]
MKTRLAILAFSFLLAACTADSDQPKKPESTPQAPSPATMTKVIETAEVHDAICGHTLKEVGHCGNYISIDGRYVELVWSALGKMEFCEADKKGAKIEVTGAMKDGKFVATSYRRVE